MDKKSTKNFHPWLIAGTAVLGFAAITFASLFTWKMVTNNGGGSTPTETDCIVTFESNGGDHVDTKKVKPGSTITKPIIEKDDYTFGGWYEKSDLSGDPFNFDTAINKDYTFYAKWDAQPTPSETYKFTFTGTNCSIDGSKSFTKEIEKGEENVQFTVNPDDEFQLDYYHAEGINLEGNTLTIDRMDKDYTVNLNGIDDDIAVIMTLRIATEESIDVSFDCVGTLTDVDWGDGKQHDMQKSHTYDTVGEYKVTVKGDLTSFSMANGKAIVLINLNIYSHIESIGTDAFNSSSLTSINFPNTVTSIGERAFQHCHALVSINLPDGLETIGNESFACCYALSSIKIPSGIKTIGSMAFYSCYSLASINLSDSLESIGESTFEYCHSLISINIPSSVAEIGKSAFSVCYSLASVNFSGNAISSIPEKAFLDCRSLSSINLPDGLETIDTEAFSGCYALSSINLPDGLKSIGEHSFYECNTLHSIKIPSSVTLIENEAFFNCPNLSIIDLTNFTIPDTSKIPEQVSSFSSIETCPTMRFYAASDEMIDTFENQHKWDVFLYLFTTDPVPSI